MAELTPKQRLFIAEYLVDKNGTQAAIRAGYSKATATEQASRLLTNVNIQEEINKQLGYQQKRIMITADKVLNDIVEIGDEAREAGDMSNALKSRELLGKHFKLFTDKVDLEVKDTSEKFSKMSVEERAKKLLENEQ